jgi:hypothetical protein
MKIRISIIAMVMVVLAFLAAVTVHATKPCPPLPFFDEKGNFDRDKCAERSNWIAVGTITNVVHHPEGMPLNKDFAEFTFVIAKWEKGEVKDPKKIQFRVGWCNNRQEVPADISGMFRFYGEALNEKAANAQYLYFERASDVSPLSEPKAIIAHQLKLLQDGETES